MEPVQSAEPPEANVQLEVRLPGISPTIWRRVLVPESVSLRNLHGVVQPTTGEASRSVGSIGDAVLRLVCVLGIERPK